MRPDETCISIDHVSIRLRPSIGAALRLLQRHKSMQALVDGVLAGNLSIVGDLIAESACESNARATFEQCIDGWSIARFLEAVGIPLLKHIGFLCGVDKDAAPMSPLDGKPIDWPKHFRDLYGLATGFLEWTPEAAWDASAIDICVAYQKRLEIVRAMHGVKDDKTERVPHFDRDPDARERLLRPSSADRKRATR